MASQMKFSCERLTADHAYVRQGLFVGSLAGFPTGPFRRTVVLGSFAADQSVSLGSDPRHKSLGVRIFGIR